MMRSRLCLRLRTWQAVWPPLSAEVPTLTQLETLADSALSDLPTVPTPTKNRERQQANQAAFVKLVRSLAAVEFSRRSAAETFTDRTRAVAVRERVGTFIDAQSKTANTNTFRALRALRASVSDHIQSILAELAACRDPAACYHRAELGALVCHLWHHRRGRQYRGTEPTASARIRAGPAGGTDDGGFICWFMTLTVSIGGEAYSGWTAGSVVRSLETISGTFDIQVSDKAPGIMSRRPIRPGQRCAVGLNGQQVLSGYVDDVSPSYSPRSHSVRITGRDATGDLVDCSVPVAPGEWKNERLEAIVASLVRPFDIRVFTNVNIGAPFALFRTEKGESVWEAIERACRFRRVLPLSDGNGGLILGRPSRTSAEVILQRGQNIIAAKGKSSWVDRYSEYTLLGQQPGTDGLSAENISHVQATAKDDGLDRHRPLTVVAEQGLDNAEAQARIDWESVIRAARSRSIEVTVQGWFEHPEGVLWHPGRLVRIVDDWLGLDRELLVDRVEQTVSERGTLTTLTLYPEEAFLPALVTEPVEVPVDATAPQRDASGWWQ